MSMAHCPTCHRRLAQGAPCPKHGDVEPCALQSDSEPNAAPPDLPGLAIERLLAVGGFSRVWEAIGKSDGEPVVIKVGRSASDLASSRFEREAETLARIKPPYVPQLHANGRLPDGRPYLVMEHLGYETLASHLQSLVDPPPLHWIRDVGVAILESLGAAHACGVVHRDLKPDNVFLPQKPSQVARLIDFGITKVLAPQKQAITREGTILGTPEYMAPEQIAGHGDIDFRSDIYTFGVILYEFLTLRVPFSGESASIEHGHQSLRPLRPSQLADVPEDIEALCLACLAKNPDRRPGTVTELRDQLERACGGETEAKTRATARQPSTSKLLTSAQQPVILLAAHLTALGQDVGSIVSRHKGVVARQWGHRYICAFSGLMDEDPLREAIATADEFCSRLGARVALHLASLKIRRSRQRGTLKVYGSDVEHPERWLPETEWDGVLFTAKITRVLPPESFRQSRTHADFFTLSTEVVKDGGEIDLIGRTDILEAAAASLHSCLETATPGLFTLLGEHGVGKSRLAAEIAKVAGEVMPPEAKLVALRAAPRGLHEPDQTCRLVLAEVAFAATGSDGDLPPLSSELSALALVRTLGVGLRRAARVRPFVLIVDDIHHADNVLLDALEYATLDSRETRLWVGTIAHPRLEGRRPHWGERAHRHERILIEPLSESAAMNLAAELLHPAKYPPAATLRRLAQWTGGNPQLLRDLVRTLKQAGLVRQRPGSEHWYVATAELDALPPSPVGQWMATRVLDEMPPELAACARLCSVIGVELSHEELEWVQSASERTSTASTPVDVDVGLSELERRGILARSGSQTWWFKEANFQAAVYQLLGRADCEQIHRHALEFWRSRACTGERDRALVAIARHAGACGERDAAADAHLSLGDRMRAGHQYIEADEHYSAALKFIADEDVNRRLRALAGRAKIRYRIQRSQEALEDISAANTLAEQLNDASTRADLMLEKATVLDWIEQFAESSQAVDAARVIIAELDNPILAARLLMARGRCAWRQERYAESVALLSDAAFRAESVGDRETQILALLLLGPGLVFAGRTEEARETFDAVVSLCERVGDGFHLCASYANRMFLWRNEPERAIDDLRSATQLARELGQPGLERITTHNLAEILHWAGEDAQALTLAQRARVLQPHVSPNPVPDDSLLLARIHASRGETGDVCRLITWVCNHISVDRMAPSDRVFLTMLELFIDRETDAESWNALIEHSKRILAAEEYLEVLYFRLRATIASGQLADSAQYLADAHTLLAKHSIFERRFAALTGDMPSLSKTH